MIGVHRNFVRQIRSTKPQAQLKRVEHRHRGAALLEAWASDWEFLDWEFLTPAGHPRDLPIRPDSREPSFETLVRRHMPGVSTGTAIAELRRSGAVRLLPDELIRLRSRTGRSPGITAAGIGAVSERMRAVATTLLHNLKTPDDQRFCEQLSEARIAPERLAVVRQMIAKRARTFLDALEAELGNEVLRSEATAGAKSLGLLICGYERTDP
jgi:hypothetical protein